MYRHRPTTTIDDPTPNRTFPTRTPAARMMWRGALAALSVTAGPLALVACGDDASNTDEPATYVVDAVDFAFEDLPDTIVAGSRIELTNSAPSEMHELVALRLPDDETRSIDEIMAGDPSTAFTTPPALVILTPPGGEQINAVGDGTLTEPGRYAIICMIPTGVDPEVFLDAAANAGDGPPVIPDAGPPHAAHGMFAEVTVTE